MKNKIQLLVYVSVILFLGCRKDNLEPSFTYDCSDTTYFYSKYDSLLYKTITYSKNNLFVRSIGYDNDIRYRNYDGMFRLIKVGSIYDNDEFYVEYKYGNNGLISEQNFSDNSKIVFKYNDEKKLIKEEYYENNILQSEYFNAYTYIDNIEMIKEYNNVGYLFYKFNIHKQTPIPVDFDSISNYTTTYYTNNLKDSTITYFQKIIFSRSIFHYDYKKRITSKKLFYYYNGELSHMSTEEFEFSQTDKMIRRINSLQYISHEDYNRYEEYRLHYDVNDELERIEIFFCPQCPLSNYILFKREGNYIIQQYFTSANVLTSYIRRTESCVLSDLQITFPESHFLEQFGFNNFNQKLNSQSNFNKFLNGFSEIERLNLNLK